MFSSPSRDSDSVPSLLKLSKKSKRGSPTRSPTRGSSINGDSISETTPLIPNADACNASATSDLPSPANADGSIGIPEGDAESCYTQQSWDAPSTSSMATKGRLLLLLVALLYGSLSVSLRMVYERPGPPTASILSATRGWMTVLCLLPIMAHSALTRRPTPAPDPPSHSDVSFYFFALELAVFNFATQGLLNIGLLTTESARSAFFTQLSVVITPFLAATIGCCRSRMVKVGIRVWTACLIAFIGLYVLSSQPSSSNGSQDNGINALSNSSSIPDENDGLEDSSPSLDGNSTVRMLQEQFVGTTSDPTWLTEASGALNGLSFGDWCCLASAFCWSYYIFRLSDWGDRYDEVQTMFYKNIFMAIFYSTWTVGSYVFQGGSIVLAILDPTLMISTLWKGFRDPVALSILLYSALSSGAISDILQQKAQAHVSAAESNVILSLEPVFAAILGLFLLAELPSIRECLGGACIVAASILASST